MMANYANKESELQQEIEQLESGTVGGGIAHKQRVINVLKKQIEQKENQMKEREEDGMKLKKRKEELLAVYNEVFLPGKAFF